MPVQTSDLAVRRHERYGCDLAARFAVAATSADAVKLARSAGDGKGWVAGRVVDTSLGGLGLRSGLFFPNGCLLRVHLTIPGGNSAAAFEPTVRVQRTTMLDRAPTYYLGTSFEDLTPEQSAQLSALLTYLKESGAPIVTEKSRA
jgi:hypothetical protein